MMIGQAEIRSPCQLSEKNPSICCFFIPEKEMPISGHKNLVYSDDSINVRIDAIIVAAAAISSGLPKKTIRVMVRNTWNALLPIVVICNASNLPMAV